MYLLFFVLWVIFNGAVTLEICLFGVVIAAAVFAFCCKFMDYSIQKEIRLMKTIPKRIRYAGILVIEIVKANFAVIHMIISEKEEVEPVLVSFESDMKTETGKVFLGNAITLTPGTITVSLDDSGYVVHALDEEFAAGIDDSVFVHLLHDMEKM